MNLEKWSHKRGQGSASWVRSGVLGAMVMGGWVAPQMAHAQDDALVTDRPDFTESTETVPRGRTQIEGGYTYTRTGGEREHSVGEFLVRHGVGDNVELRFEVPSYLRARGLAGRESGLQDGSLGFKVILRRGTDELGLKNPHISLIGAANLPIGAQRFRGSGFLPEAKLLIGANLTERVSLTSNLNYAARREDGDRYSEFAASLSLGVKLTERVGTYIETFGFLPGGRPDSKYINGGFTYLVNNDLQLDARLGRGINNSGGEPDYFVGVGVSQRF
jgi:hypothetical protein